jgi:hypothetical protein
MGKRKVSTSYTHRIGRQSKTTSYVHDDGPGKLSRFAAFTGISPWDQRRFTISAWVFVVLLAMGQSPVLGWILVALSALFLVVRRLRAEKPEPVRREIPVGPAWCDHCADWTVHATEAHTV